MLQKDDIMYHGILLFLINKNILIFFDKIYYFCNSIINRIDEILLFKSNANYMPECTGSNGSSV